MAMVLSIPHPDTSTPTQIHATSRKPSSTAELIEPEARDHVRAGLANHGLPWPSDPVGLFLSTGFGPHHRSAGHDLAAAVAILVHTHAVAAESAENVVFAAELGLDGSLRARPDTEITATLTAAARRGHHTVVLAAGNTPADLPDGVTVQHAADLTQVVMWLRMNTQQNRGTFEPITLLSGLTVQVAAAGDHPVAVLGASASERGAVVDLVDNLYSTAVTGPGTGQTPQGLFRIPDLSRTPSPVGRVLLHQAPQVRLAATGAACPCQDTGCECTPEQIRHHRLALATAWPELHLWLHLPADFTAGDGVAPMTGAAERVRRARAAADARWTTPNAAVPKDILMGDLTLDPGTKTALAEFIRQHRPSPAQTDATLRVAWTLADLHGDPAPDAAAIQLAILLCSPTATM